MFAPEYVRQQPEWSSVRLKETSLLWTVWTLILKPSHTELRVPDLIWIHTCSVFHNGLIKSPGVQDCYTYCSNVNSAVSVFYLKCGKIFFMFQTVESVFRCSTCSHISCVTHLLHQRSTYNTNEVMEQATDEVLLLVSSVTWRSTTCCGKCP